MKKPKRRIGRPPKEEGTHVNEQLTIRFTQATIRNVGGRIKAREIAKQAVEQAAIKNGKSKENG